MSKELSGTWKPFPRPPHPHTRDPLAIQPSRGIGSLAPGSDLLHIFRSHIQWWNSRE